MKRTVTTTTYTCDICGMSSNDESEIREHKVAVFKKCIDEYGVESDRRDGILALDLCNECLDKAVVLEMDVGLCCPILGEGKVRFRQREE